MQVRSLLAQAMHALLPEFSAGVAAQDHSRVRMLNRRAALLLAMVATPLYLFLELFADVALRLWLRSRFVHEQVAPFRILLGASYLNLFALPGYYYLLGIGAVRSVFVSELVQLLVGLSLILAVIGYAGYMSPLVLAICLAFGIAAGTAVLIFNGRRRLPIDSFGQSRR
jgi:O-antigen/teichoic acid export membrane protein